MKLDQAVLSAIASPRRSELLRLVWTEERSAGDLHRAMPDVTFGAVSLQLKAMLAAGIVTARTEGRHRYYRADRQAVGPLAEALETMWSDSLWRLKLAAELEATRRGTLPRSSNRRGRSRRV